jgi:hypothetical protein
MCFYISDIPHFIFSILWARRPRHSSHTPHSRPRRLCQVGDSRAHGSSRTMLELYCFPSGGQVILFPSRPHPFASHDRRLFRIVRYVHIYDSSATKSDWKSAEEPQNTLIIFHPPHPRRILLIYGTSNGDKIEYFLGRETLYRIFE